MNLIRSILLIGMNLLVGSCQSQEEVRKDLVLIHQIMTDHIDHMKSTHQLSPAMSGGGFMDNIKKVGIGFSYRHDATIESTRKLIVYGVEDLLSRIHRSEEIRPYLHYDPFTASNLVYDIGFVDENFKKRKKGIAYALLMRGSINYYVAGTEEKPGYQKVFKESYEEALEIVKRDHPEVLQRESP